MSYERSVHLAGDMEIWAKAQMSTSSNTESDLWKAPPKDHVRQTIGRERQPGAMLQHSRERQPGAMLHHSGGVRRVQLENDAGELYTEQSPGKRSFFDATTVIRDAHGTMERLPTPFESGAKIVGIGVLLQGQRFPGNLPVIISVEKGSGADLSRSVNVGDQIETIDGQQTRYMENEALALSLMGPENSEVMLGLLRGPERSKISAQVRRSAVLHERRGMRMPDSSFGSLDKGLDLTAVLSNMRNSSKPPPDNYPLPTPPPSKTRQQRDYIESYEFFDSKEIQPLAHMKEVNTPQPSQPAPVETVKPADVYVSMPITQQETLPDTGISPITHEESLEEPITQEESLPATLGLVLDGVLIDGIVPGSPAFHSGETIERGDTLVKVGTSAVTKENVKETLRTYYENIGEEVVIRVKKAPPNDMEQRVATLRTVDFERFKYQTMMSEAIAKVSACNRAGKLASGMEGHLKQKNEVDKRITDLYAVFSKREYDRVERERAFVQEVQQLKEENDLFRQAIGAKKRQIGTMQGQIDKVTEEYVKLSAEAQEVLATKAKLQHEAEIRAREIKQREYEIQALMGHDENYKIAVDKVAALTEVTLTQTAEIFRLNELVMQMDHELQQVRSKLTHREMGIEEAMHRWHDDDDQFGEGVVFEPNRSLAGTWVPLS